MQKQTVAGVLLAFMLLFGPDIVGAGEGEGNKERGEAIKGTCAGCHGSDGNSSVPAMYPSIAGMDEAEFIEAMKAFRSGEREDGQMSPQARNLSDQDIRDLAAFFSAQERK